MGWSSHPSAADASVCWRRRTTISTLARMADAPGGRAESRGRCRGPTAEGLSQRADAPEVLLLGGGDAPPGMEGCVALSSDAGTTWAAAMPGRSEQYDVELRRPQSRWQALIYAASVSGQVYRSNDGGKNLEQTRCATLEKFASSRLEAPLLARIIHRRERRERREKRRKRLGSVQAKQDAGTVFSGSPVRTLLVASSALSAFSAVNNPGETASQRHLCRTNTGPRRSRAAAPARFPPEPYHLGNGG